MKSTDSTTPDVRDRIRAIMASAQRERPLDDAQACVSYLAAIDQLLSAANQGDLHVVRASDLAMLIGHIRDELDDSLAAVAHDQQERRPGLRPVSWGAT